MHHILTIVVNTVSLLQPIVRYRGYVNLKLAWHGFTVEVTVDGRKAIES
jgi:hypothetical protein